MPPPIVTASIQASILSAVANIVGQLISQYGADKPFSINTFPVLQFIILRFLNCPPYFLWQQFLEEKFPSKHEQPNSSGNTKKRRSTKKTSTNWPNALKKFLLDQSIGNVVQAFLFITIMTSLNGSSFDQVSNAVKNGLKPMVEARLRFWPLAALLSFTIVPPPQRVLFNNLVGMTWGIYLSIIEGL